MNIKYLLFLLLFLSACKPSSSFNKFIASDEIEKSEINENKINLNDVLNGKSLIAVANGNKLFILDPDFAEPLEIYDLSKDEMPTNKSFESFFISPSKNWIVWYSPIKGIISLNIREKKTEIINQASDFLNTNSFFQFLSDDILLFITNDGNMLQKVNLKTLQKESISIPYPYGNVFKISPDEKLVIFVSGYGQTVNKPKFMLTDINGKFSNQFSADINLFERNLVFWTPDSTGIFMINGANLDYYPIINPNEKNTMFSIGKDNEILNAERIDNSIFIYSKKGYWHIFDYKTQKEIARTPTSIADELNKAKFFPWSISQFLIEEAINDQDVKFNRLWISDFRGNKKIIMKRYNEIVIETDTQKIN